MDQQTEFKIKISEEESVKVITNILDTAGIPYRRTKPGEEGGFFYTDENGKRKKFTENIFVKRLEKFAKQEGGNK